MRTGVAANLNEVVAGLNKRGYIDLKAHVSVIPAAGVLPVDVDFRKRHTAAEIENKRPARRVVASPRFGIPAHAAPRQFPLSAPRLRIRIERTGNRPVVRQTNWNRRLQRFGNYIVSNLKSVWGLQIKRRFLPFLP